MYSEIFTTVNYTLELSHLCRVATEPPPVVLPEAAIWSLNCRCLCLSFAFMLTNSCARLSSNNDSSFCHYQKSCSKQCRSLFSVCNSVIVLFVIAFRSICADWQSRPNCVSVQIPSYSHFLFNWPLIQLQSCSSGDVTATFVLCVSSFCSWFSKGEIFIYWKKQETDSC